MLWTRTLLPCQKGYLLSFRKIMTGIVPSIKWIVQMAWVLWRFIRSIPAYSLFTMILKQRAVIGMEILIKIYWKSTIAERGVRAAACPAVPVFIWARVTYPSTQWITVHRKCLSHSSITVEFPLCWIWKLWQRILREHWLKAALTFCNLRKSSAWTEPASLWGRKTKLSISFPNFTLYRIVCKNLISRLKYKNCFCSCIWSM